MSNSSLNTYAVAIGCNAESKSNSIVLNATGLKVESPVDSTCILKPVRKSYKMPTNLLTYDEVTGEVTVVPIEVVAKACKLKQE